MIPKSEFLIFSPQLTEFLGLSSLNASHRSVLSQICILVSHLSKTGIPMSLIWYKIFSEFVGARTPIKAFSHLVLQPHLPFACRSLADFTPTVPRWYDCFHTSLPSPMKLTISGIPALAHTFFGQDLISCPRPDHMSLPESSMGSPTCFFRFILLSYI